MASAQIQIDTGSGYGAPSAFAEATAGSAVSFKVADAEGLRSISWRFFGNHSPDAVNPTLTLSGTPYGQIASCTLPSGYGQAYGIEVTATTDAGVTVVETNKVLVRFSHDNAIATPVLVGETLEEDPTHGVTVKINWLLENAFNGTTGPAGPPGGESYPWTYATSTTDADPGSGLLRLDGALGVATYVYINTTSAVSVDMTDWLDSITGGTLTMHSASDGTKFAVYEIETVETATGYRKIKIRSIYIANGALTTTAADTIVSLDRGGSGGGSQDIFEVAVTATLGTAAANTVTYEAVAVPGVLAGDVVIAVDTDDIGTPTSVLQCVVTDDDEITMPLCNPSGSGDSVGELDLKFLVYRPGSSLRQYTATVDFGTALDIETTYVTASVPGVLAGDYVVAAVHAINAPSGTGMCRVTGAGTVEIPVVNPSGSDDVIGSLSVTFTVVRPAVAGFLLISKDYAPGTIPADDAPHDSEAWVNVAAGDYVCNLSGDLSATDLAFADARVSAGDTVEIGFANPSAGGIDPSTVTTTALIYRPSSAGGPTGDPGATGPTGLTGAAGAAGVDGRAGGESWYFTANTNTIDSDPTSGKIRLNNVSAPLATHIYVDEEDVDATDLNEWYATIAAGDHITLFSDDDRTRIAVYQVVDTTNRGGYWDFEVLFVDGKSGTWTFGTAAGNTVFTLARGGRSGVANASKNGLGAIINTWRRIHVDSSDLAQSADRVWYWAEEFGEWQCISFVPGSGASGSPAAYTTSGTLAMFAPDNERGTAGLTANGAYNPSDVVNPYGLRRAATFGTDAYSEGANCAMAFRHPVNGYTRIVATSNRVSGQDSTTKKLWTSDNGGYNWTTRTLTRSDTVGPSVVVFTGTNLVATFGGSAGYAYVEYSADYGDTWQQAAKPQSLGHNMMVCDDRGIIVGVSGAASYCEYSLDHGATWGTGTFGSFATDEYISGLVYSASLGVFLFLTNQSRVATSTDGINWSDWQDVEFEMPAWRPRDDMEPLDTYGLKMCGELMVCPFYNRNVPTVQESDLFYSADGVTWKRSGGFGLSIIGIPSTSGNAKRTRLATTTAGTWSNPDRLQMLFTDKMGGGYGDSYLSHADVPQRSGGGGESTGATLLGSEQLLRFNFDSSTTMADPGSGEFRLDNATASSVTQIAVSDANVDGQTVASLLQKNGAKVLTIRSADNAVSWQFAVTSSGTTNSTGYTLYDVTPVTAPAGIGTFGAGDEYVVEVDSVSVAEPDFPVKFSWQEDAASPFDSFSWDVFAEKPGLANGTYIAEMLIVTDGDTGDYSLAGKVIFRVKIASGVVSAVTPGSYNSDVGADPQGMSNYYGSLGNGGVSGTLTLNSGNIEATVVYGGVDYGVFCRLLFVDMVDV